MDYLQYEDYLIHYGVKGMKWGVRRYQNANGSLTAAGKKRLSDYKDKELIKNDKKYSNVKNVTKLGKTDAKIEKAKISGNTKRVDKLQAKRTQIDKTMQYNNAMKAVERSKINNMSYSQMVKEKKQVAIKSGQAAAESMLISTLGTAVLLPTTGRIYIHATTANSGAIKTNMRVSEDERNAVTDRIYGD